MNVDVSGMFWTLVGIALIGAGMGTYYYAGKLAGKQATRTDGGEWTPTISGDVRTTRLPFTAEEDDALERACCYVCPATGQRHAALQPDAITFDVDDETWTTDHACPCGRVHRFHHDEEGSVYDRDVSQPGGGPRV